MIIANSLKDKSRYEAAMQQEDAKGCTPVYYSLNNKQPDSPAKLRTHAVATKLDLVPQSTLRWIWRAEFASSLFATYWAVFLLYWWRVIVFGVGDAG